MELLPSSAVLAAAGESRTVRRRRLRKLQWRRSRSPARKRLGRGPAAGGTDSESDCQGVGRPEFQPHHASSVPRRCLGSSVLEGPVSTVMLRHIPCRYTQGSLLMEIDQLGFAGAYDFFYLPMDTRNKTSVGYAFINFTDPVAATRFMRVMDEYRFQRHLSEKIAEASPAQLQGLRQNVAHFASCAVLRARDSKCRPIVLQHGFRRDFAQLWAELQREDEEQEEQEQDQEQEQKQQQQQEQEQQQHQQQQQQTQPLGGSTEELGRLWSEDPFHVQVRRSLEDAVAELLRQSDPAKLAEKAVEDNNNNHNKKNNNNNNKHNSDPQKGSSVEDKVGVGSWVEEAFLALAQEEQFPGQSWVAEAFLKLAAGGCTPSTPVGRRKVASS
ncbi:unnamed protein product, partial [Polarella glacialis]